MLSEDFIPDEVLYTANPPTPFEIEKEIEEQNKVITPPPIPQQEEKIIIPYQVR